VIASAATEAAAGAHALAVLTEWDEFRGLDFAKIHAGMHKPAFVFDGRNILPRAALEQLGFRVFAIGKPRDA
jgi:UDPglucose 6-dehydrogenase